MYQLFGRMYGTNNFPDSSNMCHESTSVALPEVIGVPVGTVLLEDFDKTDCIFFFGHNTTTNAPRMLHPLQRPPSAACRSSPSIRCASAGLERFTNPQSPTQMVARRHAHRLAVSSGEGRRRHRRHRGHVQGRDRAGRRGTGSRARRGILDTASSRSTRTDSRPSPTSAARRTGPAGAGQRAQRARRWSRRPSLRGAEAVIANYGMGMTQHKHGVETVKMVVNLLLLRGNIGRPGAGISPVRGHSNVQGQRTVGITEKTKLVPLREAQGALQFRAAAARMA